MQNLFYFFEAIFNKCSSGQSNSNTTSKLGAKVQYVSNFSHQIEFAPVYAAVSLFFVLDYKSLKLISTTNWSKDIVDTSVKDIRAMFMNDVLVIKS